MAGALRSFRTQRLAELISFDGEAAYIGARVQRRGLDRKYEVTIKPRSRVVRLDGKAVRPIARYFGDFNVVLFAPEDLAVPRRSPGDRRRFIDRAVFNRDAAYLGNVRDYDKVVKSRNVVLRDMAAGQQSRPAGTALLDVYDAQLAQLGANVIAARRAFVAEIQPLFRDAFSAITRSGLGVDVHYQTHEALVGVTDLAQLRAALSAACQDSRSRDLARGATSVGPHRDDLAFQLEGRAAGSFASQGQLRALVLSWKTAEMQLLAAAHGEPPLLLLDDVSSELDATRNEYLFDFLRHGTSQCFITTTHPRHVLLHQNRTDFRLESGVVTAGVPE